MRKISRLIFFIMVIVLIYPSVESKADNSLRLGYSLNEDILMGSGQHSYLFAPPSPKLGKYTVLVLFIEFSNYGNQTSIQDILNNVSSVDQFYREVSYNQFWIDIWYLNTWLQLNNTREYYGQDSGSQKDVNWQDYVYDSLSAADPYINFTKYDSVLLVHAGDDQAASGDPNDLWSKASIGKWYFSYDGGVQLGIVIVAEKDPVGVLAHELGHNLELPDLYDYSGQEEFVGVWSLMASGSWLSPPSSLMAPEKFWLGWIPQQNISIVNKDVFVSTRLYPLENTGEILAVKIPIGSIYYMVEYRRKIGTDAGLPSEGIIISLINESKTSGGGIIDVYDSNSQTPSLNDAYLTAGDIYVNLNHDFYVKVISVSGAYAVLEIENGIPDLVVTNVTWSKTLSGYVLKVEIKNFGGPVQQFDTSLYLDNVFWSTKTYPSTLVRNGVALISFNLGNLSDGTHSIRVAVDPNDAIIERDETNNVLSRSIYIQSYLYAMDRYVVSDDRANVGSIQHVYMHFINYSSEQAYANKPVDINGTTYITNGTGWVDLPVTSKVVGMFRFVVMDSLATQYVTPQIIFDRVVINITFQSRRINVGSSASPQLNAYYEFDGSPFSGQIILNDSLSKGSVGLYWYTTSKIIDNKYGLTVFTSNSDYVIFDRVVIKVIDLDGRVDVGTNITNLLDLYYEYDGSTFQGYYYLNDSSVKNSVGKYGFMVTGIVDLKYGLSVYVGGEFQIIFDKVHIELWTLRDRYSAGYKADLGVRAYYLYDSSPFEGEIILNDSLIKNVPGVYAYQVDDIVDNIYGLSLSEANTVQLIFDKIILTLSVEDERINVGEEAVINYEGYYAYDNTPFQGTVIFNNTLVQDSVGKYWYSVLSVNDHLYGLTSFEANTVYVIFDRVNITLSTDKGRVDVGTSAPINIYAVYEYDGTVFQGEVLLNDSLTHIDVGIFTYSVKGIKDTRYGLTVYTSNTVSVIFDQVIIELRPKYSRVEVGEEVELDINSYYAYDGEPFEGTVYLNMPLRQSSVGLYTYTVESIEDELYGLRSFKSNSADIIFDKLSIRVNVDSTIPFTYNVAVEIFSQYENAPIEGEVLINGKPVTPVLGEKTYVASVMSPLPSITVDIEAAVGGISLSYKASTMGIGTVSLYVLVIALLLIIVISRKTRLLPGFQR